MQLKDVLSDIKTRLNDRRLHKVSEATGISYQTLLNLLKNDDANPTINTLIILQGYLDE